MARKKAGVNGGASSFPIPDAQLASEVVEGHQAKVAAAKAAVLPEEGAAGGEKSRAPETEVQK